MRKAMLKYDMAYFIKTPRVIIFGVLSFFLSALAALSARYFNELMTYVLEQEGLPPMEFDPPTVFDAYEQFFAQYHQIFVLAIIFVAVAFFTFDASKHHFPFMFSHALKRRDYMLSKWFVMLGLTFASFVLGVLVFLFYSFVMFDALHVARFVIATGLYFLLLTVFITCALLFALWFKRLFISALLTLAIYFVFNVVDTFTLGVLEIMPYQLLNHAFAVLEQTHDTVVVIQTVLVTLGFIGLLLWLTHRLFKDSDLV